MGSIFQGTLTSRYFPWMLTNLVGGPRNQISQGIDEEIENAWSWDWVR